jgi:lipid-A-disaccharide synthase
VKTDFFALPNILLKRAAVPEFFFMRGGSRQKACIDRVADALVQCNTETSRAIADALDETFVNAKSPESLMLEFLGEFVKRDAH